jgi:hypothetical protein
LKNLELNRDYNKENPELLFKDLIHILMITEPKKYILVTRHIASFISMKRSK